MDILPASEPVSDDLNINVSGPEVVENVSLQLGLGRRRRKWFSTIEHGAEKVAHGVEKGAKALWNAAKCPVAKEGCKAGVNALNKYGTKQCDKDHIATIAAKECTSHASKFQGPCASALKAALGKVCEEAMKNGGPISEHTCLKDVGCGASMDILPASEPVSDDLNINVSGPEVVENVSLQLGHGRRRRKWFSTIEHGAEKAAHGVEKGAKALWNAAKCPVAKEGCKAGVNALNKYGTKQCDKDHIATIAAKECKSHASKFQ